MIYYSFLSGPGTGCVACASDPQHLTFGFAKAGSYVPGDGGPDGIHYDARGDLWVQIHRMGGILEIDPKGLILGFVPIPNGDTQTTNFAFGGLDNRYNYFEGAATGTVYRFQTPYPGLIGPGGNRLPAQP